MSENTSMYWTGRGWTAQIVDNEDGGGWAVAMTRDGHDEPTLVVPWVMGRNKKDPKPMNQHDFNTQVKAAQDFLHRSQQQQSRAHRVSRDVVSQDGEWMRVIFDVIPDEIDPEGQLVGLNIAGEEVVRVSCPVNLDLTREMASQWVNEGCNPIYEGAEW